MIDKMRLGEHVARKILFTAALCTLCSVFVTCAARMSAAQAVNQMSFETAQKATQALFEAVRNNDKPVVMAILGAREKAVFSDDSGQEKVEREKFIEKYEEMRRLIQESNGTTVLYIGAENWPFPFPLISARGIWRFDSAAGVREIMFRRIGENETAVIQDCQSLVQADTSHVGIPTTGSKPMHGYYFRSLMPQSHNPLRDRATAVSIKSKTSKFTYIAYPAEYRSSGVMTFMVDSDGVVYAKDLGPRSKRYASALSGSHPDSTWTREK